MVDDDPPHRKFSLTISIGSDDEPGLWQMLDEIYREVRAHGLGCQMVQGGPDRGGWLEIKVDPEMTNERFFELTRAYLDKKGLTDG